MFPISDENPTLHRPVMTWLILAALIAVWLAVQGAGLDPVRVAAAACNYGLVPAELTHLRPIGFAVPIGENLACVIDDEPVNVLTPLTSMFLHGGWVHLLANAMYFWVFGNNVEDSMGSGRFLIFYLICGLAAAGTHVLVNPASPVPTIGASGAIAGVLGAYLVLYPRVRVNVIFPPFVFWTVSLAAWLVLMVWFVYQVISGLPELTPLRRDTISGGAAVWAHVGGFVAGVALVKVFEDRARVAERDALRHVLHPGHP